MQLRISEPASERARFLRFLLTGGIAAGVNVAACWLLGFVMSYEMAVTLAYLAGMTTAFILARTYVFDGRGGRVAMQYSRFALVNAIAFAQVWLVSVGLARGLFPAIGYTLHPDTVAHVIGVMSPIVTSYIGHKHLSFR
jgi:putative flippase GtrA